MHVYCNFLLLTSQRKIVRIPHFFWAGDATGWVFGEILNLSNMNPVQKWTFLILSSTCKFITTLVKRMYIIWSDLIYIFILILKNGF